MIIALAMVCVTIIVCIGIRYSCIWSCQQLEYKLYRERNPEADSRYCLRTYFYDGAKTNKESYWGYVVYDTKNDKIYTGIDPSNTRYFIYRSRTDAEVLLKEVRDLNE